MSLRHSFCHSLAASEQDRAVRIFDSFWNGRFVSTPIVNNPMIRTIPAA